MIYGIGTDVVEIGRIEKALERFGERFARAHPVRAGAEALPRAPAAGRLPRQALRGEGGLHQGARHRHPGAGQLARRLGREPAFGQAGAGIFRRSCAHCLSERGIARSHLSLTDERGVAVATVILECEE